MRVLYLHQYFRKPLDGGAIRSYYLAKALVDSGANVDLITSHNHDNIRVENVDGINVHFLPVKYDNRLSFLKRIIAFFSFMRMSYNYSKRLKNIDIVYASSTPLTVGFTALLLNKFYNIPYHFEVRDLWPEAPIQMKAIRNPLFIWFLRRIEKLIYTNATRIVALSPGMKEGVVDIIKEEDKVVVLPNMSDCKYFNLEPKNSKNSFYFGASDKFVVSYIGAIGEVNNLDSLLDVALECKKQDFKDVVFLIGGRGSKLKELKVQASKLELDNVRFVGFLNRIEVQNLLNVTDASFISFDSKPILETNSPNKFFDSIAAGKVCIVNNKGWIKDLIENNKIGFYYSKNQPKAFVEKLKLYVNDLVTLNLAKSQARKLAEQEFSRELVTEQFVGLFDLENLQKSENKTFSKSARA